MVSWDEVRYLISLEHGPFFDLNINDHAKAPPAQDSMRLKCRENTLPEEHEKRPLCF